MVYKLKTYTGQKLNVDRYGGYISFFEGYTIENCVPCCKNCNMGKGEMTKKEFLEWIKRVYKYSIEKET